MIKQVLKEKNFWNTKGPYCETVISSRIRIARNIDKMPYQNRLLDGDLDYLKKILNQFSMINNFGKNKIFDLQDMSTNDKRLLREKNIITSEMENGNNNLVLFNKKSDFTILINDEDHFRIQVIRPGLQFFDIYKLADKVDDELNNITPFAYSEKHGYLSASPTNAGVGLKVSAILHLPVMTINKKIKPLIAKLNKIGADLTASPLNEGIGSLYQISNKVSLGLSEIDLIELLDGLINKIISLEDTLRDKYISESRIELTDMIWRSYGILQYARKITYSEAMSHLSNMRLGIILGIINITDIFSINDLMVKIQWSHLQEIFDINFNSRVECNEYRSELIREKLFI